MIRAIVLAAGASRRLGEPKATADLGGRTALERLLDALAVVDRRPLVVVGAHADEIRARVRASCEWVCNEDWAEGRSTSLAAGLTHASGYDVLVAPVDVPLVTAETVAGLARAWRAAKEPEQGWLAPRLGPEGRHGHPILIGRTLLAQLDTGKELRTLRARAAPLLEWSCSDPAILDDLDTPDDLARLRERLTRGY
jgi:molybdenum cofactor cytidylyltransferase